MSTFFELEDGTRAQVIMPVAQGARLRATCFRGSRCREAGNFFVWDCFLDFLRDPEARELLTAEFKSLIDKEEVGVSHRVVLEFSRDIGWDSVIHQKELSTAEMSACVERPVNKRSVAMFLPVGVTTAPLTEFMTIVLRMHHDGHWYFTIETMYPGADCGVLRGNLTETKGFVFFHWSNPGEELEDEEE